MACAFPQCWLPANTLRDCSTEGCVQQLHHCCFAGWCHEKGYEDPPGNQAFCWACTAKRYDLFGSQASTPNHSGDEMDGTSSPTREVYGPPTPALRSADPPAPAEPAADEQDSQLPATINTEAGPTEAEERSPDEEADEEADKGPTIAEDPAETTQTAEVSAASLARAEHSRVEDQAVADRTEAEPPAESREAPAAAVEEVAPGNSTEPAAEQEAGRETESAHDEQLGATSPAREPGTSVSPALTRSPGRSSEATIDRRFPHLGERVRIGPEQRRGLVFAVDHRENVTFGVCVAFDSPQGWQRLELMNSDTYYEPIRLVDEDPVPSTAVHYVIRHQMGAHLPMAFLLGPSMGDYILAKDEWAFYCGYSPLKQIEYPDFMVVHEDESFGGRLMQTGMHVRFFSAAIPVGKNAKLGGYPAEGYAHLWCFALGNDGLQNRHYAILAPCMQPDNRACSQVDGLSYFFADIRGFERGNPKLDYGTPRLTVPRLTVSPPALIPPRPVCQVTSRPTRPSRCCLRQPTATPKLSRRPGQSMPRRRASAPWKVARHAPRRRLRRRVRRRPVAPLGLVQELSSIKTMILARRRRQHRTTAMPTARQTLTAMPTSRQTL